MKQMIPILKVGQYTDSQGKQFSITANILQEIALCYEENSAPLVKGHPKDNSPALGWIHKLSVIGDKLYASFSSVKEEFKEELKQKLFKNISASIFFPSSQSNPQKGKYCLRHVAALGATRPAIPNLGTLQEAMSFAEQNDTILFFSSHKKSLAEECQKILHQIQNPKQVIQTMDNSESSAKNDLLEEVQKAKQEILALKQELQKKYVQEQVQQLIVEQQLSPQLETKITEMILKLADKPLQSKELVLSFGELLESTTPTVYSHRFDKQDTQNTTSNQANQHPYSMEFAEFRSLEHTEVFADEVDKLHQQGMSRNEAYKQAKLNLNKGGF